MKLLRRRHDGRSRTVFLKIRCSCAFSFRPLDQTQTYRVIPHLVELVCQRVRGPVLEPADLFARQASVFDSPVIQLLRQPNVSCASAFPSSPNSVGNVGLRSL